MSQGTSLQGLFHLTAGPGRPLGHAGRGPEALMRPAAGVVCACCGQSFQVLKRHLLVAHGLTEADYRQLHGLPPEMPLMAAGYLARKAQALSGLKAEG